MASLFENMPGMTRVRNVAANITGNTGRLASGGGSSMGNLIIYGLLIAVVILIYLLLTGYKFSFKSFDIRPKRYRAFDHSHMFWKKGMGGTNNLMIAEDDLPDNMNNKYSYHFDLLLANTRNLSKIEGPYRHIFHRGSGELYTDLSGGGGRDVLPGSSQLPPYGLPKRLNPGIFLDPNTNDIIVFVDTKSKTGDVYRESGRISDIPIDKPLRLTVSVHNQVLEINLNCKLELTKVLAGEPKPVENILYGLCGRAAAQASIQNLVVWPFAIESEMLSYCCPMPFPPFQPPASTCGAETDPSLASLTSATSSAVAAIRGSTS